MNIKCQFLSVAEVLQFKIPSYLLSVLYIFPVSICPVILSPDSNTVSLASQLWYNFIRKVKLYIHLLWWPDTQTWYKEVFLFPLQIFDLPFVSLFSSRLWWLPALMHLKNAVVVVLELCYLLFRFPLMSPYFHLSFHLS